MTIPEAIDFLNALNGNVEGEPKANQRAIQLGIEALKVIVELRHYPFPDGVIQLPGEEIPTVYAPDSVSDPRD